MRIESAHINENAARFVPLRDHSMVESESTTCPSCKGKKVDRHGFDCTTCFGEGTVDE